MTINSVYIEITNQCNLNCETCYNRSGLNRERLEISAEKFKQVIDLFSSYGATRFLISGGEPTLHSNFDSILDVITKYPSFSFGIVTNGTVHHQGLLDLLNSQRNITLQVSLDGSCEALNAQIRGPGHFDQAVNFVKKIRTSAQKPVLKMVLTKNNIDDIENYYNLALSMGCIPEFSFILCAGNGSDHWLDKRVSPHQQLKALVTIDRLNTISKTPVPLPPCANICSYAKSTESISLCIKACGNIQPCQALYSDSFSLGNIFSFAPHVFEENINRVSKTAQQRSQLDFGCRSCLLRNNCGKGCMAVGINICGDPFANDGNCDFRKLKFLYYDLPRMEQSFSPTSNCSNTIVR